MLATWRRGGKMNERLREEIEEHLALQTAENLRAGLSPVEARRQAMLKFGGVEAMKEEYRAARGLLFVETLVQDVRFAIRSLQRTPGLTVRGDHARARDRDDLGDIQHGGWTGSPGDPVPHPGNVVTS